MGAQHTILQSGLLNQSSAQVVDGSLKFNKSVGTYQKRTHNAGNRKTYTWSGWIKRSSNLSTNEFFFGGGPDGSNNTEQITFFFMPTGAFRITTGSIVFRETTQLFRDPSSFYHLVVAFDTTQSTASDRIKIYVNGSLVTSYTSQGDPGQDANTGINAAVEHVLGKGAGSDYSASTYNFDGSMSQCYFIDGAALGPESFGYTDPLTNTWRPKKYTGTFTGTNTFYLPMDGNSPIGEDKSGITTINDGTAWSEYVTITEGNTGTNYNTDASNWFNGDTSSQASLYSGNMVAPYSPTTVVFTPPSAITVSSGLRVYMAIDRGQNISVNGTQTNASVSAGWNDTGFTGTLTSLTLGPTILGSSSNPTALEIDGVVLIDGVNGNSWTPVNFGCSVALDNPIVSGARPILNTDGGGNVARPGVRTDSYAANLVLALPLVGSANDVSNSVNSGSTTKTITSNGNAAASSAQSNFYGGSFYFDGSGDTLTVPNNTDFNFGSGDSTIEMWIYPTRISGTQENIMTRGTSGYSGFIMSVTNFLDTVNGSSWGVNITYDNPLIANVWQHIAVCRSGNTWTVYINGIANGSATASGSVQASAQTLTIGQRTGQTDFQGYMSDIHIYKGAAKYTSNFIPAATSPDILPDTPSGVSGSSKLTKITDGAVAFDGSGDTLTIPQNANLDFGSGDCTVECFLYISSHAADKTIVGRWEGSDQAWQLSYAAGAGNHKFSFMQNISGTQAVLSSSNSVDYVNQWVHLVGQRDGNTLQIYVNGVLEGTLSVSGAHGSLSGDIRVGGRTGGNYITGFVSNVRVLKGTALYTSNFTPPTRTLTNVTNTKLLCCQSNTSATTAAVIPTGTITANGDAAATTFNPFNTDINTVRGQETGYNTLNPLAKASITLSNGNLDLTHSGSNGNWQLVLSTIGMSSGKFYCEFLCQDADSVIGIAKGTHVIANDKYVGNDPNGWGYNGQNGQKLNNSSGSSYGSSYTAGDVIGIAFDADNGTLSFYKNNIDQGQAFTGLTDEYYFAFSIRDTGYTHSVNFGQKPFKFPPPTGFQPLNAANVRPETVITRPDHYVGATIYTGDGGASKSISGLNFGGKPDLVWVKGRSYSISHLLYDSVRGAGSTKSLVPNGSNTEGSAGDNATFGYVSSLDNNGFSLVGGSDVNNGYVNKNTATYVGWCWRAGGNKNTFNVDDVGYATASAAGLTAGTITPTGASVGTKQGFSIVKYQGTGANATIPHGLSQPLDFLIVKTLTSSINWTLWHSSLAGTQYLILNTQGAAEPLAAVWNSTVPTSSVISVGTDVGTNKDDDNYIAYCWHDVPGLQKFGSFEANQSADGPFIELGFRPAIVWIKNIDNYDPPYDWVIYDNTRSTINPNDKFLSANLANQENSGSGGTDNARYVDFLSNGFKVRTASTAINLNAHTQIYCAWAEAPTVNLYGGESNAR